MEYGNLLDAEDCCLEWHAQYEDRDGRRWQIDLIHMAENSPWAGYFERVADRIAAVLTPETREAILRLKYETPDGAKIPGIAYYKAVLADGVQPCGVHGLAAGTPRRGDRDVDTLIPSTRVHHSRLLQAQKTGTPVIGRPGFHLCCRRTAADHYIMPPIPPAGIAGAGVSDFFSASTHSVVRNIEAIEAAFSKATRDTFVGSMIPAASRSSYLSSRAL